MTNETNRWPPIQPLPQPTLPPKIPERQPRPGTLESIRIDAEDEFARLAREQALHPGLFGTNLPAEAAPTDQEQS